MTGSDLRLALIAVLLLLIWLICRTVNEIWERWLGADDLFDEEEDEDGDQDGE